MKPLQFHRETGWGREHKGDHMNAQRIRIDRKQFLLAGAEDPDALRERLVEAVRLGGDFVRFETDEGHEIAALITAHFEVWMEEVPLDRGVRGSSSPYLPGLFGVDAVSENYAVEHSA
jgi:hypothetical protein